VVSEDRPSGFADRGIGDRGFMRRGLIAPGRLISGSGTWVGATAGERGGEGVRSLRRAWAASALPLRIHERRVAGADFVRPHVTEQRDHRQALRQICCPTPRQCLVLLIALPAMGFHGLRPSPPTHFRGNYALDNNGYC
jgi:hypothetical protein